MKMKISLVFLTAFAAQAVETLWQSHFQPKAIRMSRHLASASGDASSQGNSSWTAYKGLLDCQLYRSLSLANGRIEIREVLDPINGTLTVEMTYNGHGWLGISLASNGDMIGNIAVIGRPDMNVSINNPAKYALKAETVAGVVRLPQLRQTLTHTSLTQNKTHTVMRFTKLLSELNEQEILKGPSMNTALYAVGPGNQLEQHQYVGSFEIMYTYCLKPGEDPSISEGDVAESSGKNKQSLWILHGFFMAFGWGVLVPLAIGASLLRSILPFSEGTWFKLHRALNLSAMACILSGFIVALVNGDTPFTELLQEQGHVTYGLSVVVIAFVQVMSGLFRPHKHATLSNTDKEQSESFQDDHQDAKPQKQRTSWRVLWEAQHRFMGFGLLAFAWFTVQTGLETYEEDYDKRGLAIFFWTVACVIVFVIACFTIYAKFLRR